MDFKNKFVEDWKWVRGLTIKFIEELPEDTLSFTPHENIGNIGKQLRHLIAVQECYIEGFKHGKIDFSKKRKSEELEQSKTKLLEYAKNTDGELFHLLETFKEDDMDRIIEWKVWESLPNPTINECLLYMLEHETFHQGVLQTCSRIGRFEKIKFF